MIQVTPDIAAGRIYDELINADGSPRPGAHSLLKFLQELSPEVLAEKGQALEAVIKSQGSRFWSIRIHPTSTAPGRWIWCLG